MSTIIVPSLEQSIILKVFAYLVGEEFLSRYAESDNALIMCGRQQGTIHILQILFQSTSPHKITTRSKRVPGWPEVVRQITDRIDGDPSNMTLESMNQKIEEAVAKYALENPTTLRDCLGI